MSRSGTAFGIVVGAGALAAAFLVGLEHARAEGIPTQDPLSYTGQLSNNGTPVTGKHLIEVNLWLDPTSTATADRACATTPVGTTTVKDGRFRIALDPSCLQAIHQDPDLYAEVVVDGTPLPRTKVGAVPYAVEADAASHASGALKASIDALKNRVATNPATGSVYSLGAVYCGQGPATDGHITSGSDVGYRAAKLLCEAACSSPGAHMCTGDEVTRSIALGFTFPTTDWFASSTTAFWNTLPYTDCYGYTSNATELGGSETNGNSIGWSRCNNAYQIACCD